MALDEIGMIGKRMLGKIHYRMRDTLGDESREYNFDPLCVPSLNGKDCVINGHMLQTRPIGDTESYREMPRQASPKSKSKAPEKGAPSNDDLAVQGNLFFNEFKDVVMLRQKHRASDLTDDRVKEMPAAEKQQFLAESDRFQEVLERMADLTWSREDHAWLSQRNQSVLARTEEGRRELDCLLYTSPSPRDKRQSRMPSSA